MKITCQREALTAAFSLAASIAPTRSPKEILLNVKITAAGDKITSLERDCRLSEHVLRLQLNHSCGAQGTIFVELQDANGFPIPGFTLADCEEVAGDDVAWEIRWRGSADLSNLAGQPVKLHFKMRNAKLFAFQFVD